MRRKLIDARQLDLQEKFLELLKDQDYVYSEVQTIYTLK